MSLDPRRTSRLLLRYRFMFRFSLMAAVIGALIAGGGVVASITAGGISGAVPAGLLFVVLGGFLARRVVYSTVRILDRDSSPWRSHVQA